MIKAEYLMGVLVLALVSILFLTERPIPPQNIPRVEEIATLPAGPELEKVRRYTEYGSGLLPYSKFEQRARAGLKWNEQPLKLGWSYREITFAALPVIAYREYGLVTYIEQPAGYQIAILRPSQVALLQQLTGRDFSGYTFPVWKHVWGWLFALGFILAGWLYFCEENRKREAAGII